MTISPMQDMTFPRNMGDDDGSAQPPQAIAATASPMTIIAMRRCAVHIDGTLTACALTRGTWSGTLAIGSRIFEMNRADRLTITYLIAPTITILPR